MSGKDEEIYTPEPLMRPPHHHLWRESDLRARFDCAGKDTTARVAPGDVSGVEGQEIAVRIRLLPETGNYANGLDQLRLFHKVYV